jgi:hypothetical protein
VLDPNAPNIRLEIVKAAIDFVGKVVDGHRIVAEVRRQSGQPNLPATVCQLIHSIRPMLPPPVRGTTTMIGGGDPGLVVVLTSSFIEVSEYGGIKAPELLRVTLDVSTLTREAIEEAIGAARLRRLSKYRYCLICGRCLPPEWMSGEQCVPCLWGFPREPGASSRCHRPSG